MGEGRQNNYFLILNCAISQTWRLLKLLIQFILLIRKRPRLLIRKRTGYQSCLSGSMDGLGKEKGNFSGPLKRGETSPKIKSMHSPSRRQMASNLLNHSPKEHFLPFPTHLCVPSKLSLTSKNISM